MFQRSTFALVAALLLTFSQMTAQDVGTIMEKPAEKPVLNQPSKAIQNTQPAKADTRAASGSDAKNVATQTKTVVADGSQGWVCPDYLVSEKSGISTTISILNHGSRTELATLLLYNANGEKLAKVGLKIGAGEKVVVDNITDETGYVQKEVNGYLEIRTQSDALILSGWTTYAAQDRHFSFRDLNWQRF